MEKNSSRNFMDMATRVLAVFGFLAIIGAGLWGSVAVARNVPGAFSAIAAAIVSLTSIFVPAGEELVLSVPSLTVVSGEPITLSWAHEKKTVDGSYTFRYDCVNGVSFNSPTASGSEVTIFCNTPFNFVNANDSLTLTPQSTQNRYVDVTLHVDFTPNGASQPTVTGSTILTVANEGVTGSPTTTGGTTTTPPVTTVGGSNTTPRTPGTSTSGTYVLPTGPSTVSDPNGFVDLAPRIIEVGIVNKETGEFTASSTPSRAGQDYRVAVRFAVENNGTRTSNQWTFNAVLPTYPSHIFSSPTQQALGPGDRIEFTLGFDSFVDNDEGTLILNIDPSNRINEPNKTNNILNYKVQTVK